MTFGFSNFGELGEVISRLNEEEKKAPVCFLEHGDENIIRFGHVEIAGPEGVSAMSGDTIDEGEPYLW